MSLEKNKIKELEDEIAELEEEIDLLQGEISEDERIYEELRSKAENVLFEIRKLESKVWDIEKEIEEKNNELNSLKLSNINKNMESEFNV